MINTVNRTLDEMLDSPARVAAELRPSRPQRCHIVHVVPSLDPAYGGPATVAAHLAAAQAALGHQVTIVSALDPKRRNALHASTESIPGFSSVRLLVCPWASATARWFGRRLSPIYHSLFPYADLVHIHGVWEPMLLLAANAARLHDIPYVVRPCGMLDPWSLRQRAWKKKIAMNLFQESMLNRAAFLHVLNTEESSLIEPLRLNVPHAVIPNGVSLDEIDGPADEQALFEKVPGIAGRRYILFLGRCHHKKGLDILAQAFAQIATKHSDVHLLVVGPGAEDRDGDCTKIAGEFHKVLGTESLRRRVHVPGPLYGPAKFAAYRHAACFCLPSRQEGFSLSITEALASRVPVAISTECHFPEVAQIGAGEIFPLNAAAAAKALDRLLCLPEEERQVMGDAGREYVTRWLTWPRIAEQTLTAYGRILAARRA